MGKAVKVHVTHFESPTQFYFRFEDSEQQKSQNQHCRRKIESEVYRFAKDAFLKQECARICGSIVGYLHYKRHRWERAKIVKMCPKGTLRVFLCDRGYFMELYRGQEVKLIDLPKSLQQPSEIIQEGSLAVQPCDKVQDRDTSTVINSPVRYWDQKAISLVQQYNQKKGTTEFDWTLVLIKTEAGTHYGDLLLKTPLETRSLSEELINKNFAISCDGTKSDLKPLALRPSSNFKKIIMTCCPELLAQKAIRTNQKSEKLLPTGVQVGSCSNKNLIDQLKHVPNRSDKWNNQTVPQQPLVLFPSDIIVFGQHLRPALESMDSTTFTTEIKDYLKTNLQMMTKVQSHAWPQICYGRSIVIIPASGSSSVLPMTFLPPLISNITLNCKVAAAGVGPTAVVIAQSLSDVKDIQRICTSLAPFLKIEVLGIESKAVQLINGCDLLLSTPPAFVRTVGGTKINLFNRDRIKTLVFHGVDQNIGKFDSEVNEIVRRCSYGHKNVDKNPQIIVTSNIWFKNIEKFMVLIAPSKLVLCVESFIEAAALSRIKIVMEISSNNEAKFESMSNDLKRGKYKTTRTAVVVNDEKSLEYLVEKFSESSIQVLPADQRNFENAKTNWMREEMGKYSVLIATDATIVAMKLKAIQNLVHFSIPKTWSTFAQRFSTLVLNFYKCLERKIEPNSISTKIFIDEEKNINEFIRLVKFMESRNMESIPATMIESVKILLNRDEQLKCMKKLPICDKIWMFGECTEYPCLFRHVFATYDVSSEHIRSKSAIKFEVVDVLSPANYVIKILSQKIGTKWTSSEETNIFKELQKFCASSERLKQIEIKATESYVALFEKTWRRCTAIMNNEPNNPLCKIHLIDEGRDVHCKSSNMYSLPDQFRDQSPLVFKLSIMNLVPSHGENCWSPEANKEIADMIKSYNDCILTADIKFAVQNTLFCNSIEAEDSEFGAVKFRFPNKLTKFCVKDEKAGKRLMKLFQDASLIPENSSNSCMVEEVEKFEQPETTQNSTTETDEHSTKENWKQLSWNSFYDVRICHFKNPDSFFVVLPSKHNKSLQDIGNTSDDIEPIGNVCVGATCLVKREKMLRGKILRVNNESVQVFLADLGDIVECKASDLYSVSKEIISKICFQSVHCRFVGVRPKFNMKTWPPKQCEAIEKLIREIGEPLRMYVMKKNEKIDELCIAGQSSYEVVLIDPKTEKHLDDMVVIKSYADRDKYEKPKGLENDSFCGNDSEESGVDNADDILKRMLESMIKERMNELSETESASEEVEVTSKIQPLESQIREVQKPNTIPIALSYLVKHPLILWQQNEVKVHLSISAIDCVDYGMKIGDTTVEVTILYADSRYEKASIDLYCGIIPKICSHELRGLNIIAELVKLEPNIEWPRLTEAKERSQFIRFSNENIKEGGSNLPLKAIPAEEISSLESVEAQNCWELEHLEKSDSEDF